MTTAAYGWGTSWLGGVLFDASGAYTWAIIASAVTSGLGLPLALYLPRHKKFVASRVEVVGTA